MIGLIEKMKDKLEKILLGVLPILAAISILGVGFLGFLATL